MIPTAATLGMAVLVVASAAGCSDSPLPGRLLGTYKVTGQSASNTCGLGAPSPWVFSVQLSEQGSTLYWSFQDGSPLLSGTLGPESQVSLRSSGSANADSTDAGLGPCTLERDADLELALASGSPPPSFGGTVTYAFTPATGARCGDQLAGSGGQFAALPCTVKYMVSAARQ